MKELTKHERVFRTIEGKEVDRTPVGFWLHFPEEQHHGENAIKAHWDFMEKTDSDIMKIMNENILYDGENHISCLNDISKFRGFSRHDTIFKDQMEIIKRITEKTDGRYPVVATIHGLVASVFHETGYAGNYTSMGYGLPLFCRERPEQMKKVFQTVAESLMEFSDCSLEAGAEGIFYAALGGERNFFTDEEFAEFIAPYEKMIYDHIKKTAKLDILHICKTNIDFQRYIDLHPMIVNWGIYGNDVSLTQGSQLFPDSVILGGFPDRHGVLVNGTDEEIEDHTEAVLQEMKGKRFIVGSDCTLPTKIEYTRINKVVKAIEKLES